jgi:hypothetical protein
MMGDRVNNKYASRYSDRHIQKSKSMKNSIRIDVEVRVFGKKIKRKRLREALKWLSSLIITVLPIILSHIHLG